LHQLQQQQNVFPENPDRKIAAVANKFAANLYGLKVIHENIHDVEENHTRFIVISKTENSYENEMQSIGKKQRF
jgi:prephenate dehydratase